MTGGLKNVLELYTFGKGLYSISGGFQIEEALQPGFFENLSAKKGRVKQQGCQLGLSCVVFKTVVKLLKMDMCRFLVSRRKKLVAQACCGKLFVYSAAPFEAQSFKLSTNLRPRFFSKLLVQPFEKRLEKGNHHPRKRGTAPFHNPSTLRQRHP